MRIEVSTEDITWKCGECGNTYDLGVEFCPNNILDKALLELFIKRSEKAEKAKRKPRSKK